MNAIKEARRFIAKNPDDASATILARLVLALESERSFELVTLYQLDFDAFELAIKILKEWRLDRYYVGKAKLFDLSMQVSEMGVPPTAHVAAHPAAHGGAGASSGPAASPPAG